MKRKIVKKVKKIKKVIKKARKIIKKKIKKSVKKDKKSKQIGVVTHYYGKIKVGIVKFNKPISLGANIRFLGATTNFSQIIKSMQYDHKEVGKAAAKKEIGMKVAKKVRSGDAVFLED